MASRCNSTVSKFPAGGSYEYFMEEFLLKNRPCVFDETLTSQWPSRRLWVDQHGRPNLHYLCREYGGYTVPVADCAREQFSAHPKSEMKMSDYLTYWSELMKKREQQEEDEPCKLLYLKDWHLARETGPNVFYSTPDYFQSDWLNEVWLARNDVQDDYRFVYIGPKGTWTPFHADVFRSYSWSANICGMKEWLLYPPGQEEYLRDPLGNLPFNVTSADLKDEKKYPNASKACEPIRVIQQAGETIFVPSGWYHQVKNLEDTISINHNWTNAFGVKFMWKHLQNELKLVREELADCRAMDGWEEQCQVVLRACAGMDYWEMAQLLCLIGLPRLNKTRSLLSSLHLSSDALSSIEENVSKIMKSSRKWTFFDGGVFPAELQSHNSVVENIATIERPTKQGSVPPENFPLPLLLHLLPKSFQDFPLPVLLHLLPKSFQELLAAFSEASCHLTGQRSISQMTYTLFELYTINEVLEEVVHSLDN